MKKLFLAALAALVSMAATAQKEVGTVTVYPKISINFSTISNDVVFYGGTGATEAMGSDYKPGLTVGAECQWQLCKRFAASAGLAYSMQGTGYDVSRIDGGGYDVTGMKQTLHYANVPIMAVLYVAHGISLRAGVQGGYLLGARMDGADNVAMFKRFDFSVPVGIAYEYKGFVAELRYNHGLSKLYKHSNKRTCNRNIAITIGYGLDL